MARNVNVGDTVYVPSNKFSELANWPYAFYKTDVVAVAERTATVNLPDQQVGTISFQLCRTEIGIAIFNIGDFETEETLLNPLHKTTLQFCRLLASDDCVFSWNIRSLAELKAIWQKNQMAFSTAILISHGSGSSIKFANDDWVSPEGLKECIYVRGEPKKVFVFLSCNSGYKNFGGKVSKFPNCSDFLGPFHSVNGADASLFCQSFLRDYLVTGHSVKTAFSHARNALKPAISFRLWRNGTLQS